MAETEKTNEDLKFEAALARLEAIVAEMESGELPLEESMKRFEEGMTLTRLCAAKLGETERKIEMLIRTAEGENEWREVDLGTDAGDDAP